MWMPLVTRTVEGKNVVNNLATMKERMKIIEKLLLGSPVAENVYWKSQSPQLRQSTSTAKLRFAINAC